jgi:putative Holliday junction resolvase
MPKTSSEQQILALDIGEKRIGVAIASYVSLLPSPLITLANDEDFFNNLSDIITKQQVNLVVVGLPRGLDGQETAQTETIRRMTNEIEASLGLRTVFQDEALTSQKAKEELDGRGRIYTKPDVDKLAACFILEDYIKDNSN